LIDNEQTRKQRIEKALAALLAGHETLRVPWRGRQERMPVIRIGLESIVLNPRSHRIRSQLESAPDARAAIEANPDGEAAQLAIRGLLRATPGFEDLKDNLKDDGQVQPGIVTRDGRLINANTRATALRDIGTDYIDVAVLPPDATVGELYDLELDLQVAQDFRQEYSFTNTLLFVEDLITGQNRDEEDVAIRTRWATPTKPATIKTGVARVRQYVRHLNLIREIQDMSGGKVPLTDFDDAEQALKEFDISYENLRVKEPRAAQALKDARTLGLLVDLGYERQRVVDGDWVDSYLAEALRENEILREVVEPTDDIDDAAAPAQGTTGLEDFEDIGSDEEGSADSGSTRNVVRLLARRLAESASEEAVVLPTSHGEKKFDREIFKAAINDAMRTAAEDARSAARAGNELRLPLSLLEEGAKLLSRSLAAYDKVASHQDFDTPGMQAGIDQVSRALEALRRSVEG
jgi:hypothetical protein